MNLNSPDLPYPTSQIVPTSPPYMSYASFNLFQDKEKLYLFTDAFPTQIPDFPQDKRSLIANEIFTTERTFVRGLELLVQVRCLFVVGIWFLAETVVGI